MSYYVVDVETDGASPMRSSMVCFGAVKVTDKLDETFYGEVAPINNTWNPEALAISGFSREEHKKFPLPAMTIRKFHDWVLQTNEGGRPIFWSDNLAFDWMWMACYFDMLNMENPFGWSGRRIGDVYTGFYKEPNKKWKHLRKTKHTHHPVDDAKGNAEVLLHMKNDLGIKFKF